MPEKQPFWKRKSLGQMSRSEWESLCDGCGKCCLVLLIDDENDTIWETDVACPLFDASCRKCRDYENRAKRMKDCIPLTPDNVATLKWMPESCAYRLIHEGKDLFDWHPLLSGNRGTVVEAGMAVGDDLPSEEAFTEEELTTRIVKQRV